MTSELPAVLYHYTCNHGLNGIIADRKLLPNPHPWIGHPLVWLTDLDVPDRAGLGLTAHHITCDRTENRVEVAYNPVIRPWTEWATWTQVPYLVRDTIEGGGGLPMHWWVSTVAVPLGSFQRSRGRLGKALS